MSEFGTLECFAADLIASLEPPARKALAQQLARELRLSQQKRIAAQLAPDGSPFVSRKPQLRHKKGKLRAMFAKLRTTKYLKARSSSDAAIVDFVDNVQRIGLVHQRGLRDRVNHKSSLEANYPARPLLGLSAADEALIRDIATAHLAARL